MPLTALQRVVMRVLRPFRTAESYVGGGAALNDRWPRLSDDMDIFSDRREGLPRGVDAEVEALRHAGFAVEISTHNEWMVEVILRRFGEETKVQWMDEPETCRRFFPAQPDDELGFRLHQADVAVNKVLCAARRDRAPRDAVDLVNIFSRYAPLGPLIWAVAAKDPELPPPHAIRAIRRNAFGYADEEIMTVRMDGDVPMTRQELRRVLEPALDQARVYCDDIAPANHAGCLFIDVDEIPVEADDQAIAVGAASALPIREFGITPNFDDR